MQKTFEHWTFNGTHFLAVPNLAGDAMHITDDSGRNYGAWTRVRRFRLQQRKHYAIAEALADTRVIPTFRIIAS